MKAETEEMIFNLLKVAAMASTVAIVATLLIAALFWAPARPSIHTTHRVEYGETIYDIASNAAYLTASPEKVNINELAFNIQKDNHITDPGNIQPGVLLGINY